MNKVFDEEGNLVDVKMQRGQMCWFYDDNKYSSPILDVFSHEELGRYFRMGSKISFSRVEYFIGELPSVMKFKEGIYE